jgi:hypothetical protein|tara:strand:+ start:169 stop:357 length:189 start_codon:yes stop_codon:yes gene_type:complete
MEEYVDSVLIDMSKRQFKLFSDQGDERVVDCETYDQFMSVFKLVRDKVDEEMIFYTKPNVAA